MSLVGPRAALPLESENYSEKQRRRLELRPGLTRLWQVVGRTNMVDSFDGMVEMDLEYAAKQSLLLDIKILMRTVVVAVTGTGGY
jgi:lipopolysaccharide/colanic/teichoic acid biosynthesis glycosyltransferase